MVAPAEIQSFQTRLIAAVLDQGKSEPDARAVLAEFGVTEDKFNILLPRARAIRKNTGARLPENTDPNDWRQECKSFGQLTRELPRFLISGLVPEKALTAICAPSFNGKTWFSLAMGHAISTAKSLFGEFAGPETPVPAIYHVPEMNEAYVRQYMDTIGIEDSDMFLVRPMEMGLWPLDNPKMLKSSEGRVAFLDTQGYFNPAEDPSAYQQSLHFANLVYRLLNNGTVAVVALFHPPKYASKENEHWSLETSILGSAGYGGILRSCLRMKNLNPDLNDENIWVYVQGMKNPGLKPFQLEGIPLRMKVPPGSSPYLKELLSDPRYQEACVYLKQGISQDKIAKAMHASKRDVSAWAARLRGETEDQETHTALDMEQPNCV